MGTDKKTHARKLDLQILVVCQIEAADEHQSIVGVRAHGKIKDPIVENPVVKLAEVEHDNTACN